MRHNLQFDFLADKEANTITVVREFMADRQLIWDAYTKIELLEQWFAPKPLTTKTKSIDFSEGGAWVYAMVDPGGKEYWGRTDYLTVEPIDRYTALDGFCDETGTLNPELPRAEWEVSFNDAGENAMVKTVIKYKSLNDLEVVLQMGMQEGLTMTLDELDNLLETLKIQ